MMSTLKKLCVCLSLIMGIVGISGCEQKSTLERAGDTIKEAAEDTGEALEDAQEKAEDAIEERNKK